MGVGSNAKQPGDLYETLGVPVTITSRRVRRLARTLRREPECPLLDTACVAEHVLGDARLRAEYDDLVARMRAANLPVPQIGRAIVVAPLPPTWAQRARRVFGGVAGRAATLVTSAALLVAKLVVPIGFIALVCIGIARSPSRRYTPSQTKLDLSTVEFSSLYTPTVDTSKWIEEQTKNDSAWFQAVQGIVKAQQEMEQQRQRALEAQRRRALGSSPGTSSSSRRAR